MNNQTNHRNTKQRQTILSELQDVSSHPTAAELYDMVRARMPKISLGTVYRNLEVLTQLGQIRRLDFGTGETRYDGDLHSHYHVRCRLCGRVDDVHELAINPLGQHIDSLSGYKILGHHLEFIGICPSCQAGRAAAGQADPPAGDSRTR